MCTHGVLYVDYGIIVLLIITVPARLRIQAREERVYKIIRFDGYPNVLELYCEYAFENAGLTPQLYHRVG